MNTNLDRADIDENVAVIKINKSYKPTLSELELYDITRGCWKRKLDSVKDTQYALAVAFGIVVEVYKIDKWVPADQLHRETIPFDADLEKGRIGFFGEVAVDTISDKYINRSVKGLYKHGEADPVKIFITKQIIADDINTPRKPFSEIETENEIIIACPKCKTEFLKALRCPKCGQLIDYVKVLNK